MASTSERNQSESDMDCDEIICDLSDTSDTEIYSYHDTDSEQNSEADEELPNDDSEFYFGKGGGWCHKMEKGKTPIRTRSVNIIYQLPGPKFEAKSIESESDAFTKIIDNECMKRDAKLTTVTEILALFGLLIMSGIKRAAHSTYKELWAVDGSGVEIDHLKIRSQLKNLPRSLRGLIILHCKKAESPETEMSVESEPKKRKRCYVCPSTKVRGCIPNVDCGIRRSYLGPKQLLSVVQNVLKGREDVNDEERAGCPSTSTTDEKINEVEKMILANRRITVREVAEDLNISIGSCYSIFINDLGMRRVAAKFVPKLLNCDQKQHRMNIANEMLDSVRDDPNLLQRVITGDEAWVYGYDVETKAQSSQWKLPHEPRPKKARQVRSNVKVLLTVFFDCRGVVHHEFLPQGRTVNKEYYLQVMRNLREAIRQKRPDLWKNKNWLLHHDNAPAHTSLLVRDFLAKNNTLMMPQPPHSPDLAPCDFFLLPKLKRPMKGRRYATLDEIKTASKEELKKIF
ncbi:hypothetical protein LAZ67_8001310 [Cordylochernes scorpioides]|uniref:Transposase n=1 Tax=Cordylochernes scorpioides TaxID=51811 RepID=A0ABY6KQ36_9ARAC|nr:hypothetical protein LAZ67_8001310 [Cordylochernes scorpioides]